MLRFLLLLVLATLGFAIYDMNLQASNSSLGFQPISMGFEHGVLLVAWVCLAATLMPAQIRAPSDIFLLFYVVVCFLWGSVLWSSTALLSFQHAVVLLVLLYLPHFILVGARRTLGSRFESTFFPIFLFRHQGLPVPLVALLFAGAGLAFAAMGPGRDWGLDTVHLRRLAGREVLANWTASGYVINIATNGAAPLLGFVAGWRRSPFLALAALALVVVMFWMFGVKSPTFNVIALGISGLLLSMSWARRNFVVLTLLGLIGIYGAVIIEILVNNYSILADYVIRRITVVQPQVQSYYLDYWLNLDFREKILGAQRGPYADWTYLIGDTYLGNDATNANTNAYLYALIKGGLLGYTIAIVVVIGFILAVDALFKRSGMPEFVSIAGIFGILISEQAHTTALFSSGIALVTVVVVLFSAGRNNQERWHAKGE